MGTEEVSEDEMEEIVQDEVVDISENVVEYNEQTCLTCPEDDCYPPWLYFTPQN